MKDNLSILLKHTYSNKVHYCTISLKNLHNDSVQYVSVLAKPFILAKGRDSTHIWTAYRHPDMLIISLHWWVVDHMFIWVRQMDQLVLQTVSDSGFFWNWAGFIWMQVHVYHSSTISYKSTAEPHEATQEVWKTDLPPADSIACRSGVTNNSFVIQLISFIRCDGGKH